MLIKKDYKVGLATLTQEPGEAFDLSRLDVAIQFVLQDPKDLNIIDLVIDTRAMNLYVEGLRSRHFTIAGNVPDSGTLIRMRRVLDGTYTGGLAVTPVPPPKSNVEYAVLEASNKKIDALLASLQRRPEDPDEYVSRKGAA
jgi:hypothetical protein